MAKLDEMFESGSLHTAKYLPLVLKKMKEESDKMMGEYWGTLPYYTAEAARQQELWMRSFAEHGGESGLNAFWESWAQIVEQSRGSAEVFGRFFERISKDFSGLILLPQEFVRWTQGETDERNFFQSLFGAAPIEEISYQLSQFRDELSYIPEALSNLRESFEGAVEIFNKLSAPFGDNTSKVTASDATAAGVKSVGAVEWISDGLGGIAKLFKGDFSGAGEDLTKWWGQRDVSEGNRQARISAEEILTRRYGEDKEDWPEDVMHEVIQQETSRLTSPAGLNQVRREEFDKFFPLWRPIKEGIFGVEQKRYSDVPYPFTSVGMADPLHFNMPPSLQGIGNTDISNPALISLRTAIRDVASKDSAERRGYLPPHLSTMESLTRSSLGHPLPTTPTIVGAEGIRSHESAYMILEDMLNRVSRGQITVPPNTYSPVFQNSGLNNGQTITVKHEVTIDAKVEARTDMDAMESVMHRSFQDALQDVNRTITMGGR